ncbi:DUF5602 domain-containing protein [Gillisia sp. Q332]|uniref:DUF5602 domain-containing protein n=1 Tax=Gillisia xinjiangensis TaxID=3384765 RepID=UPI00391D4D5B
MKKSKNFLAMPQILLKFFPLIIVFLFSSCEKEALTAIENQSADLSFLPSKAHPEKMNTFYGPAKPFGKGVARAMVTMTHDGEPRAIGIKFSERALENLPTDPEEFTFQLPNKAKGLAFDHIDLGWNPEGHEPPGIYDIPHFDIHFYMISEEEKMGITDPDLAEILPPSQLWPENYFSTPGFVPMMGKHWLNMFADELEPEGIFTQTFIYGSYNGEFIFYEPMITLGYLLEKSSIQYNISQPAAFQRTGYYYPTTYSINYDSTKKEYTISLEGMVLR